MKRLSIHLESDCLIGKRRSCRRPDVRLSSLDTELVELARPHQLEEPSHIMSSSVRNCQKSNNPSPLIVPTITSPDALFTNPGADEKMLNETINFHRMSRHLHATESDDDRAPDHPSTDDHRTFSHDPPLFDVHHSFSHESNPPYNVDDEPD